jgi:hypothetical protein
MHEFIKFAEHIMDKFVIGMLKMDTKEIIQHSLIPSACSVNANAISRNDMTPLLAMTKINMRTQMQMHGIFRVTD